MKKIVINLEYKCFPIWQYDEKDCLLDNDLPEEFIGDTRIDPLCVEVQTLFDNLYRDDSKEFSYRGFASSAEKDKFKEKFLHMEELVRDLMSETYEIQNRFDVDQLRGE